MLASKKKTYIDYIWKRGTANQSKILIVLFDFLCKYGVMMIKQIPVKGYHQTDAIRPELGLYDFHGFNLWIIPITCICIRYLDNENLKTLSCYWKTHCC